MKSTCPSCKKWIGAGQQHECQPTFADRYQELHWLGYQDWEIAKRMGIKLHSLVRQMDRNNIPIPLLTQSMAAEERGQRRKSAS